MFVEVRNEFYRDINVIFLVFDLSDEKSYNNLENWIEELK